MALNTAQACKEIFKNVLQNPLLDIKSFVFAFNLQRPPLREDFMLTGDELCSRAAVQAAVLRLSEQLNPDDRDFLSSFHFFFRPPSIYIFPGSGVALMSNFEQLLRGIWRPDTNEILNMSL